MSARILIADDEDSLRWVLEKGLRQAGYEVTSVKDGTAATRAVEAEAYDLVFLDIRMPGVDGLSALARMREIRADACVVVMTAHGTMETAIQAMQRGAYDYLTKPFDLDEVLLMAERALAGRPAHPGGGPAQDRACRKSASSARSSAATRACRTSTRRSVGSPAAT